MTSELVAVWPRRVLTCIVVAALLLSMPACTPVAVRKTMSDLPPTGAAYGLSYAKFGSLLPDWYQFYSLLSGPSDAVTACVAEHTYRFKEKNRRLKIINCSEASKIEVSDLVKKIQIGLNSVEDRFGHDVHVSRAVFKLFNIGDRYESRQTALVRPKHLTLKIAFQYDSSAPKKSARDIVRTTAHELFHIARDVTRRSHMTAISSRLSEEVRASLFESCVDQDVYGSIEKSAFDKKMQFNPDLVQDVTSAHVSAKGSIHAYEILSNITGKDHRLSTAAERSRFNRLCREVVH